MNMVIAIIFACGHENIRATHGTTFEITKELALTKRGDCIIAVGATKGAADLPVGFKEAARSEGAQMTITIEAGELKEVVRARGSPRLVFTHPTDLVVRKSNYVCGRTLAIGADKAASDFSRELIEKIRDSNQNIRITLAVKSYRISASTATCQVKGAIARTVLANKTFLTSRLVRFMASINRTLAVSRGSGALVNS